MENSADEAPATRRRSHAPAQPTSSPITVPPTSSTPASSRTYHQGSCSAVGTDWAASATTRMTTGASLNPDSASSIPLSRRGSGTVLSTENTAAASVELRIAPMSSATVQSRLRT